MSTVEERCGEEQYCYLTTIGRKSGQPHEIEIWFGAEGDTIYLMNGSGEGVTAGQADWVKNIQANPAVRVRIGDEEFEGVARALEFGGPEHERARDLPCRSTGLRRTTSRPGARAVSLLRSSSPHDGPREVGGDGRFRTLVAADQWRVSPPHRNL